METMLGIEIKRNITGICNPEKYITAIIFEVEGRDRISYFDNSGSTAKEAGQQSEKYFNQFIKSLPKDTKNMRYRTYQLGLSSFYLT